MKKIKTLKSKKVALTPPNTDLGPSFLIVGIGASAGGPNSAEFKVKPSSAIALGIVDMVLPPQGIAEELARISNFPDEMNSSR